ncbi:hypothetical protein DSM104299_05160 [Baekduia alba]|uniref:hypothetical protein n=1 Tax=Baekduia alba TaxID=2997333 RepID=UPI002340602E|nr:hypothetical protein [Baekduia alba]WCB96401.1 hypothetical protein DSM104299_05160 [Baekduia alba]
MTPTVTIRPAYPDDAAAVARLAALDSQRVPAGPLLLAEIDGEPWAAIAIVSARVVADPFRPTAALVELLRRRVAQLAQNAVEGTSNGSRRSRPQLAVAPERPVARVARVARPFSRPRPSARRGGTSAEA